MKAVYATVALAGLTALPASAQTTTSPALTEVSEAQKWYQAAHACLQIVAKAAPKDEAADYSKFVELFSSSHKPQAGDKKWFESKLAGAYMRDTLIKTSSGNVEAVQPVLGFMDRQIIRCFRAEKPTI